MPETLLEKVIIALIAAIAIFKTGDALAQVTYLPTPSAQVQGKAVNRAEVAASKELSFSAKVLTIACGARKIGMPFTEEELGMMVRIGTAQPAMNDIICKTFLTRDAV